MFSFKNKFIVLLLWSSLIDVLLLMPMPTGGEGGPIFIDKIVHFLLFGVFSLLLAYFLEEFKVVGKLYKVILISSFVSISYASLMEIIQAYVPSRTKSIYDFLSGALGAIIFLSIYYVRRKKR